MATKPLNIGLVGYGFMGRTHSNAFLQAPRYFSLPCTPVLKAIAARNRSRAEAFAANWGYQSVESDWRRLVERKDIDLIDIASPNDTHAEIAIAAAGAGKMVLCEKPLARSAAEAEAMVSAVEGAGVPNSVWYNYRRVPAVVLLRELIDQGTLGLFFTPKPSAVSSDVVLEAKAISSDKLRATTRLSRDTRVWALRPDLVPGIASIEVSARTPDGGTEILLLARNPGIEWPTPYIMNAPRLLRRGTEVSFVVQKPSASAGGRIRLTMSRF